MGFDTECDLSIEAGEKEEALRTRILRLRHDLLAEHLGVEIAEVEKAVRSANGSLIRAINALRSNGRSLVLFEPPVLNQVEEELLAENELLDPERPSRRGGACGYRVGSRGRSRHARTPRLADTLWIGFVTHKLGWLHSSTCDR